MPRISVLLPVRDAAATLEACLDSLAVRTLADHEVVAVDDGSRDGSGDVLRAAARRDPRLRVTSIPPRGLVGALRLALAEARAPLVARPDAVVWGAGPVGKAWARALRAAGHEVRAFVEVDPRKVGGRIHGAPVVAVDEAPGLRGPLHLAAVGQKGARARIRAEAARRGLAEGVDLVAVA